MDSAGKGVWDCFDTPTTPRKVMRHKAVSHADPAQQLRDMATMVDLLLEKGFLVAADQDAAVEDEAPPPPSPDENPLRSLYIHMTDRCNLQCIYCYNQGYRESTDKLQELDMDTLQQLLDDAAELSVKSVVFTGGEPLLRRESIEAANYARKLGIKTTCLTNGSLLTRRAGEAAKAFDQIVVSFDSWVAEENERIRVGCQPERISTGIRDMVESGVDVTIRPVITKHNVESMAGFPEWAERELGCTSFQPALCSPISADDIGLLDFLPSLESYRQAKQGFKRALKTLGKGNKRELPTKTRTAQCGAGTGMLSIAPNGDVFPCQCLHIDGKAAGNIHQQPLESIWRTSPVLAQFRQERTEPFSACHDCAVQGLCTLNCRAIYDAFRSEEKTFTDAMCRYAAVEIEDQLWREADRLAALDGN